MFSSLLRKSKSLTYTDIENSVRDATNSEPYNVPSAKLFDIALYTHRHHKDYDKMFAIIHRRLTDYAYPRHVWKSLILIHYLLLHGSNRFINDINRDMKPYIRRLRSYHYYKDGFDVTEEIRKQTSKIMELLENKDVLQQARIHAAKLAQELYGAGGGQSTSNTSSHFYGTSYHDNYGSGTDTIGNAGQIKGSSHNTSADGQTQKNGWFVENDEWTMPEQTTTTTAFFNEPDPFAEHFHDTESTPSHMGSYTSQHTPTTTTPRVSSAGSHSSSTTQSHQSVKNRPTSSHSISNHTQAQQHGNAFRTSSRGRVQSASVSHAHPPQQQHHGATTTSITPTQHRTSLTMASPPATADPFGGFDPFSQPQQQQRPPHQQPTPRVQSSDPFGPSTGDPFASNQPHPHPQQMQPGGYYPNNIPPYNPHLQPFSPGYAPSTGSMVNAAPSTALVPAAGPSNGTMSVYSGYSNAVSPYTEQPLEHNHAYISYQQQQQFTVQYHQHQQQQQSVIVQTNLDYFDTVEPMKYRQSIHLNTKDTYEPVKHDPKKSVVTEQKKTSIDDLDIGI